MTRHCVIYKPVTLSGRQSAYWLSLCMLWFNFRCHQSLTTSWIHRYTFVPSYTNCSLWGTPCDDDHGDDNDCDSVLSVLGSCSQFCDSNGCWGPADDECIQCARYRLHGRCVDNCDLADGYYVNSSTRECWPCHRECANTCTGPVSLTLHVILHICPANVVWH